MKLLLPLAFLVLVGCNSNPYPKDGEITRTPERNPWELRPALGIDAPDLMSFKEGSEGFYRVAVRVPSGDPVIVWEGLPDGIVYDQVKGELKWVPDFSAANDPSDASVRSRQYPVNLILSSTTDRITSIRKTILMQVQDTPRPVVISGLRADYSVNEGQSVEVTRFEVASADFSSNDISISLKNNSQGLSFERGDRSGQWVLKAFYGFDTARVGTCSSWNCEREIKDTLVAMGPDGRKTESPITLKVKDVRRNVTASVPASFDVTGDFKFTFNSVDPNQEIAPLVRISKSPELGVFEIKRIVTNNFLNPQYEATYELSWSQIPPTAVGQVFQATLELCNSRVSSSPGTTNCTTQAIQLNVLEREVALPTIARGDWEISRVKYIQHNSAFTHRLTIGSGRNGLNILSVSALSSDKEDEVTINGGNVRILSQKPGLKSLNVSVMNSVGGIANEVFLYEVMPQSWSQNILIGANAPVAEFEALEKVLGTSNREYRGGMNLDARALFQRRTVFAGTHSMMLPGAMDDLSFFAKNLSRVVIMTGALEKLPAEIVSELRAQNVFIAGRSSTDADFNLQKVLVTPAARLGSPKDVVSLSGKLTSESQDPSLFAVLSSSSCEKIFTLVLPTAIPKEYVAGVSCRRANGGRLVVLGFEMADLAFTEQDAPMLEQWLKRITE